MEVPLAHFNLSEDYETMNSADIEHEGPSKYLLFSLDRLNANFKSKFSR